MKHKISLVAIAAALGLATGAPLAAAEQGQGQQQASQQGQQAQGKGAPLHVGPEVIRQVQQALKDAGHDAGPVDGTWGDQTKQALTEYQQANNLEPTGNINLSTLSNLGIEVSEFAAGEFQPQGSQQPGADPMSRGQQQPGAEPMEQDRPQ
jgi:peptidoglycan hydrolase-like protein with peptidoglycan-binding domain